MSQRTRPCRKIAMADTITLCKTERHNALMAHHLPRLRRARAFTDFKIRIQDDYLPCHKLILAVYSPYMNTMLTSDMAEAAKQQVTFNHIPLEIMKVVLDYMYEGDVTLQKDQLMGTIEAADYLQMDELKNMCIGQVPQLLEPSSVMSWFKLALDINSDDLKDHCVELLALNIDKYSSGEEFLRLKYADVQSLLRKVSEWKADKDAVLHAAFKWVKHAPGERLCNVENLLEDIQLNKCSLQAIKQVIQEYTLLLDQKPMLYKILNNALLELIPCKNTSNEAQACETEKMEGENAAVTTEIQPTDETQSTNVTQSSTANQSVTETKSTNASNPTTETKPMTEGHTVIEAQTTTEAQPITEAQTTADVQPITEAQKVAEAQATTKTKLTTDNQPITEAQAIANFKAQTIAEAQPITDAQPVTESLLLLGGYQEYIVNKTIWNIGQSDDFEEMCTVPFDLKKQHSVCATPTGFIVTGGKLSTSCKEFNAHNKVWKSLKSMVSKRYAHGSAYFSKHQLLFVLGGNPNMKSVHAMVENKWHVGPDMPFPAVFPSIATIEDSLFLYDGCSNRLLKLDLKDNTWQKKASPQTNDEQNRGATVMVSQGLLFLAGGRSRIFAWYTPETDTWCIGAQPHLCHNYGSLVCFRGEYMLLGGSWENGTEKVEKYHNERQEWNIVSKTPGCKLFLHHSIVLNV